MVSILALFACMATWFPAAGFIAALSPLGKFGYGCGLLSIVGFVLASLIIVGDVSPEGSEILAAFIVAVIAVLVFAIGETVGWKIVRGWLTIKR